MLITGLLALDWNQQLFGNKLSARIYALRKVVALDLIYQTALP
jgi:hypothetical protein